MKKYLISILTHNSLELLNLSIYSAINQNFKDYDIHIIVNSTNNNYYNKVIELCNNKYKHKIIKIIKQNLMENQEKDIIVLLMNLKKLIIHIY